MDTQKEKEVVISYIICRARDFTPCVPDVSFAFLFPLGGGRKERAGGKRSKINDPVPMDCDVGFGKKRK